MQQNKYWDGVSSSKNFTTPFQSKIFTRLVPKSSSILDVGCGYGRTLDGLYQDFSQVMIRRGKKQSPYLDLRWMPTADIEFPDNSFDAAILFVALTCIHKDEGQIHLLSEIHRFLSPGGILYVNDFLLNSDGRNLCRYQSYQEKYGNYGVFELPEGAILRHHSKEWIQQLMSQFQTETYSGITFTTMNGHTSNGSYYFGRKPQVLQ